MLRRAGYLWLTLVLLFMAAPTIFVVINSFNASPFSSFPPTGLSIQWYQAAVDYQPFRSGLAYSLIVGSISTVISLFAGTTAAIALVRGDFRGRDAIRSFFTSPLVVPRVVLGLAGYILFITTFKAAFGPTSLVDNPIPLVAVHTLLELPLVIIVMSTGLARCDITIEDAARDLGANPLGAFVRITLPALRPWVIIAAILAFNTSFDEVEATIFLVPISGNTLPIDLYLYLQQSQTPTVAAVSVIMLAVSVLVVVCAFAAGGARSFIGDLSSGRRNPPSPSAGGTLGLENEADGIASRPGLADDQPGRSTRPAGGGSSGSGR
jgi:putative spermidine/putrescine transport system permease protein